jgi:hypothetical protein
MLLEELMAYLPELFRKAQYAAEDAPKVLALIKGISPTEIRGAPAEAAPGTP